MSGVSFEAFDYTPAYMQDYPMQWTEAIEYLRNTIKYSDPSILQDASRAMAVDVLEDITQPIDESAEKPGRESGRVVTKRGISVRHNKPKFQKSIATFGSLLFETPFGWHRIFKPGGQVGPFGQKRRAFLLWDVSSSNNSSLDRAGSSKPNLYKGGYFGSSRTYERFNTGQLAMMMLLSDAIESEVLVSTYIFPSSGAREAFDRVQRTDEKVKYPNPENPSKTRTAKPTKDGSFSSDGYEPACHWVDEDPEKVLSEIAGMKHLSNFSGGAERCGSAYLKLWDDLNSKVKVGEEGVVMITDIDKANYFLRRDNYADWAWLTYFIDQRADFYIVNITDTDDCSHYFYATYPGEMDEDFGILGMTSPEAREEVREWLKEERGATKVNEAMVDNFMSRYLNAKIDEKARELAFKNGVDFKGVDSPEDFTVDQLKNRFIRVEEVIINHSGSKAEDIYRHPWCQAAEEVLYDYMQQHLAVEKKIEADLRRELNIDSATEVWEIRDGLSSLWEERLRDYDAQKDWDLSRHKRGISGHEVYHNIRVRYKDLYINYFQVDDTNAGAVVQGLKDLRPDENLEVSRKEDLRKYTLTDEERREMEKYYESEKDMQGLL